MKEEDAVCFVSELAEVAQRYGWVVSSNLVLEGERIELIVQPPKIGFIEEKKKCEHLHTTYVAHTECIHCAECEMHLLDLNR